MEDGGRLIGNIKEHKRGEISEGRMTLYVKMKVKISKKRKEMGNVRKYVLETFWLFLEMEE